MNRYQLNNWEFAVKKLIKNDKKTIGRMRHCDSRCCLAVMCDAVAELGIKISENGYLPNPKKFRDCFGFEVGTFFQIDGEISSLQNHNDGNEACKIKPKSHETIGKQLLYGVERLKDKMDF